MNQLIEKYNQIRVTEEQLQYIKNLCSSDPEKGQVIIEEVVGTKVDDLAEIPKHRAYIIIKKLSKIAKMTPRQLGLIQRILTLEECSKRLNRTITDYNEISLSDFKALIQPKDRFSFKSRDTPLISLNTFEYGWQESNLCQDQKLYYLRLYDLLMIDIDHKNLPEIERKLRTTPETFRIYETHNGYHIFITTRPINHKDPAASGLMDYLECDPFYIKFSYKNGYKIRLTPKLNRGETFLAKYVKTIGNREDPECLELLEIHDFYIEEHQKKFTSNSEDGKPITSEDGKPITSEDGKPITSEDGKPITSEDGKPITSNSEDGKPITSNSADGKPNCNEV